MTDIAISVQNLGKKYTIGHQKSGSLRESFASKVRGLFTPSSMEQEEFWALRDINFEIKRGEAVGIIGRNGAGKSTLLKILSRITDPSTGRFEINGRVSSLLEVGTGFHPELSGRENIYLNGTILGMKRAEIKAKFDEIVSFSGVEKFIDTPVKHYSSGMKVRLAFSVAAHLEPEILIVDEVLAVGDAEFQKKCLGKMDEVSKNEGRTVVFVSHNMVAVESLCKYGLLIEDGIIKLNDNIGNIVNGYLNSLRAYESSVQKSRIMTLELMKLVSVKNEPNNLVKCGSTFSILMLIRNDSNIILDNVRVALGISNLEGQRILHLDTALNNQGIKLRSESATQVEFVLENNPLIQGVYFVTVFISYKDEPQIWVKDFMMFTVVEGNFYGSGRLPKKEQAQVLVPFNIKLND
ncbi:ABC transporter ATP-binding protein [Cytophagales bacterium LB-30]|uniref:ABC transporter ATP-binding protein n=1 Tax=Shiella aurantiaca TaxID=3058365 RepID=A0ABT8F3D6_9BACT|nr:ABC transporter ATP-binding protein [Shiella aurantiaca]MDN4164754.1 ABC transporter ATP-binding protein [Shiella aurantiaca]